MEKSTSPGAAAAKKNTSLFSSNKISFEVLNLQFCKNGVLRVKKKFGK